MESSITYLRYTHIFCGGLILLLGLLQILVPKFSLRHKSLGVFYFHLMWIVCVSAIIISSIRFLSPEKNGSVFLFVISWFTLYLICSGLIHGRFKDAPSSPYGKLIVYSGYFIGAGLIVLGLFMLNGNHLTLTITSFVFALVQLRFAHSDYHFLIKKKNKIAHGKNTWLIHHLGRMIGSYIGATTAFLVNAVEIGPPLAKWLGPTIFGTFLIIYFTKKYSRPDTPNALQEISSSTN